MVILPVQLLILSGCLVLPMTLVCMSGFVHDIDTKVNITHTYWTALVVKSRWALYVKKKVRLHQGIIFKAVTIQVEKNTQRGQTSAKSAHYSHMVLS